MKTPLYQLFAAGKENSLFDMEALAMKVPACRGVAGAKLPEGIEAFKFQGPAYGEKSETWVFAAVGVPKGEVPTGGFPAVLLIHGGDGRVFPEWIEFWTKKGYVAIAFDLFANELDSRGEKVSNPEGGHPEKDGSNFDGVDAPKQSWVYQSIYNAIMAGNLLRARADVDSRRICVTGISWGGVITNILSGVDNRFTAFAPMYGCGFLPQDGFWKNGYGEFGGAGNLRAWMDLYDPSSYLPYSTKPMLFISGIDDAFFEAVHRKKSAALIKGKAFYSQRTELPHGHCWDLAHEIDAFFRHVLYGEASYFTSLEAVECGGAVRLQTDGGLREKTAVSVKLCYTCSVDENSHQWVWNTITMGEDSGNTCKLPGGVTAYFIELSWECGGEKIYQSTPVYLKRM